MKGSKYWQSVKEHDRTKLSDNQTFEVHKAGIYEVWTWDEVIKGAPLFFLKAFRGKAGKPFQYYYYRKAERREKSLDNLLKEGKTFAEYKEKQKAENKGLSSHAHVAAIIRGKLKANFPNTKFQVRSESFAGGNSVDVYWTDGPTSDQVEKLIAMYQAGYFDGMTDCYNYVKQISVNEDGKLESMPTVKYVHTHRNYSDKTAEIIKAELVKMFGLEGMTDGEIRERTGALDLNNFLWRVFVKIDLSDSTAHEIVQNDNLSNYLN